jgi:hypothetical protein
MTIIRRGVEKIGSFSIKKKYTALIDASDAAEGEVEFCLAMLAIPSYCHIGYIHSLNYQITTPSEYDPWQTVECVVRGGIGNVPTSLSFNDDDWNALLEDNLPTDPTTMAGADADTTSVDITGKEHVAENAHEFFRRSYTLGLPNNAYPVDSSKIKFFAKGNYKGHARTNGQTLIELPKLFGIGVTVDNPAYDADKSDSMGGGATNSESLYQAIKAALPSAGAGDIGPTLGEDLTSGMRAYLYEGIAHDDHSVAMNAAAGDIRINLSLSARLDVYEPTAANYVPAP